MLWPFIVDPELDLVGAPLNVNGVPAVIGVHPVPDDVGLRRAVEDEAVGISEGLSRKEEERAFGKPGRKIKVTGMRKMRKGVICK